MIEHLELIKLRLSRGFVERADVDWLIEQLEGFKLKPTPAEPDLANTEAIEALLTEALNTELFTLGFRVNRMSETFGMLQHKLRKEILALVDGKVKELRDELTGDGRR